VKATMEADRHPSSYYFLNLGCPKNLVDAERVAGKLERFGWVEARSAGEARLLVVTTCAFISIAEEESVHEILQMASIKQDWQKLAVVGCLVSREGRELERLLPEVDIFLAVDEMDMLPERISGVERGTVTDKGAGGAVCRKLFTPAHLAYLKIAEGCSNHCSYCTIPSIRGELRSRATEEIVREAEYLAGAGVKELVIVAQDTGAWGRDAGGGGALTALVESVSKVFLPGWIRLMYLHPSHIDPGPVIDLIEGGVICPYLDIPIQHVSDSILSRMARGYGRADLERLFGALRSSPIDIALRTTVMVGFPGEGDDEFDELLRFLEQVEFDHVGVFTYSDEEGTAAASLGYKVSDSLARSRKEELLDVQMDISHARLTARTGFTETILVDEMLEAGERPSPGVWGIGRSARQAYDVDGVTFLEGAAVQTGDFVKARIRKAEAYDLFAVVCQDFD
jgi:ribosomal protein S12 methylthiotransferase